MSTQDNEVQAEEIDQFTHMIRSQGQRIVSLNLNLMVYADAPGIRKNYLEKAVSALRSMAGAESMVESVDTLALFMANLPGNAFNNYRWLVMSEPMATCYLSFMGQYPEQKSGDVLCDRFLNPVRLNCFNTALANQNAIVIGPSGSGKSFTNGYFLIQRKERGCKQIIIDVGGTYKNMLLTLNGKDFEQTYIEYDPKLMQFAPFLVEKDDSGNYLYQVERGNFLMSLLFTLAKGKDSKNIRQVEKSVLKNLITRYYQHLNQHRLPAGFNTFYEYVGELSRLRDGDEQLAKDFKYFDVDEFLTVCRPFYDGDYRQLLNGDAEKDLSEFDLICFDLARIKADTMLYPIISQLITQAALDQIAKFPDQEKYIYMDEAWTMLSDSMSEFIEYMYRTIRKNKGSIWIITQTIHEIIKSPVGQAILGNADTKVLLKHADQQLIEKTAGVLGLTSHQQDLLCSLRKEKHFREILVVMADVARVFAIEASAHHATILSSTPDERNEFVRLINHYGNLGQALNEFVERKQKHDATI
jgi:type IV secretory pathway VirB4 component